MKKILAVIICSFFAYACTITDADKSQSKTPQTTRGQFYSCMQEEAYKQKEKGYLDDADLDIWTTAQEIQVKCRRKLGLSKNDINPTQSIEIIASTLKSMR